MSSASTITTDTLQVVVRRREVQGGAVVVLDLRSADDSPLPAFEAGAHIDVHVAEDLVRQYSLCGDPADAGRYRLGVLRDPASRGGSSAVFDRLSEGTTLTIGAPRNHFPLAADAQHSVLVGGGIGITPMISMAHALQAAGRSFELHYCARSAASSAFVDELTAAPFADKVTLHFDDAGEASKLQLAAILAAAGTSGTHLYTCGPSGFMEWVIATGENWNCAANTFSATPLSTAATTLSAPVMVICEMPESSICSPSTPWPPGTSVTSSPASSKKPMFSA